MVTYKNRINPSLLKKTEEKSIQKTHDVIYFFKIDNLLEKVCSLVLVTVILLLTHHTQAQSGETIERQH